MVTTVARQAIAYRSDECAFSALADKQPVAREAFLKQRLPETVLSRNNTLRY